MPTHEEIERLISAAETPREKAIARTLYSTGIRISELVRLKLDAVHKSPVAIDVREAIVRNRIGDERIMPFDPSAIEAIAEYETSHPGRKRYLFESETGRILTTGDILLMLNRLARRANLAHPIQPGTLRAACQLRLLNGGMPISSVEAMLGKQIRFSKQDRLKHLKVMMEKYDPRNERRKKLDSSNNLKRRVYDE